MSSSLKSIFVPRRYIKESASTTTLIPFCSITSSKGPSFPGSQYFITYLLPLQPSAHESPRISSYSSWCSKRDPYQRVSWTAIRGRGLPQPLSTINHSTIHYKCHCLRRALQLPLLAVLTGVDDFRERSAHDSLQRRGRASNCGNATIHLSTKRNWRRKRRARENLPILVLHAVDCM